MAGRGEGEVLVFSGGICLFGGMIAFFRIIFNVDLGCISACFCWCYFWHQFNYYFWWFGCCVLSRWYFLKRLAIISCRLTGGDDVTGCNLIVDRQVRI